MKEFKDTETHPVLDNNKWEKQCLRLHDLQMKLTIDSIHEKIPVIAFNGHVHQSADKIYIISHIPPHIAHMR